ncbi:Pr6Pr family membrane protein [Sinomonas atrocyanea]
MSGLSAAHPPVGRSLGFNYALHPDRPWVRLVRAAMGTAMLAALAQETYDATQPGNSVDIPQLFSQFTFHSNLVLGLVLLVSAARPRASLPHWWDHLFGALAFYLVMTGIVYAVLVAPPDEPWWTLDLYWPWMITHRIAPLVAGLDWLTVTRTVHGSWLRPLAWLCYPAAFVAFSWVRGALDGWYPYDFLDPRHDGGWPAVLVTSGEVLAAFLVVGTLVHIAGNARVALSTRSA